MYTLEQVARSAERRFYNQIPKNPTIRFQTPYTASLKLASLLTQSASDHDPVLSPHPFITPLLPSDEILFHYSEIEQHMLVVSEQAVECRRRCTLDIHAQLYLKMLIEARHDTLGFLRISGEDHEESGRNW